MVFKQWLVPKTEWQYDQLIRLLDFLLDAGGVDERHPLAWVVDLISELLIPNEAAHYPFGEKIMSSHGGEKAL